MVSKINCKQTHLYTGLEMVCDGLQEHLSVFTTRKTKYNQAFIDAFRLEISQAKSMPDRAARLDKPTTQRIELMDMAAIIRTEFQILKGYIEDTFDKAVWSVKFDAAGQSYFNSANSNLDNLKALLTSATNFITENEAVLQQNGFMPATFKADLLALKDQFELNRSGYLSASQQAKGSETELKMVTNTAIMEKGKAVIRDAKRYLPKDSVAYNQFVWDNIVSKLGGGTTAALRRKTLKKNKTSVPVSVPAPNVGIVQPSEA